MKTLSIEQISGLLKANTETILLKAFETKCGHIGGSLSLSQFLLPLLLDLEILKPTPYKIILSKGHASLGLYSILHTIGVTSEPLRKFCSLAPNSHHGHTCSKSHHSILASTGSLGHGLPISAGYAYGLSLQNDITPTLCVVGDGELQEGTVWETLLHLAESNLNLKILIDYNCSIESKTLDVLLAIRSFCNVYSCNVESFSDLSFSLGLIRKPGFNIISFETTKNANLLGYENSPRWHAGIPSESELYEMMQSIHIKIS